MTAAHAAAAATVALPANATCASAPNASARGCSEQSERILGTAGADTRGGAVEGDSDLAMLSSASSSTAEGAHLLERAGANGRSRGNEPRSSVHVRGSLFAVH